MKHTPATPLPWITEHSGTGDAMLISKCEWKNKDGSDFHPTLINRIDWGNAAYIAHAAKCVSETGEGVAHDCQ